MRSPVQSWVSLLSKNTEDEALAVKKQVLFVCLDRSIAVAVSPLFWLQITQFKVEGKDYTLETLVQRVENPVRQMNFGEYLDYFICDNLDFPFSDIDQQWLKGYEMFLIRSGKKENTVGIRFRSLRVL